MDIIIREDEAFVYADVSDAEADTELYIELRSVPVEPNESTDGPTAAVHRLVAADGTTHFKVPRDYLLPDFPRDIVAIGPITARTFAS